MLFVKYALCAIIILTSVIISILVLKQDTKNTGLGSLTGASVSGDTYWAKNKKHSAEGRMISGTRICIIILVVSCLAYLKIF